MRQLLPVVSLFLVAGCAVTPPAHWAQGGAPTEIPGARWVRGDVTIDLQRTGKVLINGEHELTLDRAGRLFEPRGAPVALLEPDGRVVGPGDAPLGFVGQSSASMPGEKTAWLSILPTGEVVRFDDLGARAPMGVWIGDCQATPRTRQVCMFVSHIVGSRLRNQTPSGPVTFGFGVGFGVPIR